MAATEAALLTSDSIPPGTKEALVKPVARELRQWMRTGGSRRVGSQKRARPEVRQSTLKTKKKVETVAVPIEMVPAAKRTCPRKRQTEVQRLQRPSGWIDLTPGLRPKRKKT